MWSFWNSSIYPVHTEIPSWRFKIYTLWRPFWKCSILRGEKHCSCGQQAERRGKRQVKLQSILEFSRSRHVRLLLMPLFVISITLFSHLFTLFSWPSSCSQTVPLNRNCLRITRKYYSKFDSRVQKKMQGRLDSSEDSYLQCEIWMRTLCLTKPLCWMWSVLG